MPTPAIRSSLHEVYVHALPAPLRAGAARFGGDWVPASALVALGEAVLADGGREALRRWAVAAGLGAQQLPSFLPFTEAARAKGGFEPSVQLEHLCLAWHAHAQGCGTIAIVSSAEDGASLVQFPLAPELRVDAYLLAMAGLVESLPVACGLEAGVTVRGGAWLDRAEYDVGWWVPGATL